ncbi:MAG: hypothetical protein V4675_06040 [Verrucomicrobiota bacterium]
MPEPEKPNTEHMGESPLCPDCGEATRRGVFTLGQTKFDWWFNGWSLTQLFFKEDGRTKKSGNSIISWVDIPPRIGWCCPKCGFAMIKGKEASKTEDELRQRRKAEALLKQPSRDEWWKKYH